MKLIAAAAAIAALSMLGMTTSAAADDASVIADCLKSEGAENRDLHSCVGRISGPCSETPEGQSTVGTASCMQREEKVWDGVLNAQYQQLLKLLKPEAAEDLRKAQRIWLTARDADCRMPYYFFEGGSIVQILGANCTLDATAGRALLIQSWREMAEGKE